MQSFEMLRKASTTYKNSSSLTSTQPGLGQFLMIFDIFLDNLKLFIKNYMNLQNPSTQTVKVN
jgi:hypothetical protein